MAIISIISVGVYNAYLLIIAQTRAGQDKQVAALEGKQVIENLKSATFKYDGTQTSLILDGTELTKTENAEDPNSIYFSTTDGEYKKEIILKRTQTTDSTDIESNNNQTSNLESTNSYKVYIVRENSKNCLTDILDNEGEPKDTKPLASESTSGLEKITLSIYIEKGDNEKDENIIIYDYKGDNLLKRPKDIDKNLIINFSKYKEGDLIPNDIEIQMNIYNKTEDDVTNIYIQKPVSLKAEVTVRKGEINLYDNRAESENKVGNLYDVTVNITDKNRNGDNLFTGHSKQNIIWEK